MEDGTRSGPDITMDTTLYLTTMAKTYGEVRDTRPALTEYLQAVHHQGEASVRPQPYAERLAAAQQRAYPEHQRQAARQPEGLQSEQLRQQGLHQQYEEQLARAALQELGYSPAEIQNALKGADPNASTEELVRHALRAMVMKG
jgi:hypothetical protein